MRLIPQSRPYPASVICVAGLKLSNDRSEPDTVITKHLRERNEGTSCEPSAKQALTARAFQIDLLNWGGYGQFNQSFRSYDTRPEID